MKTTTVFQYLSLAGLAVVSGSAMAQADTATTASLFENATQRINTQLIQPAMITASIAFLLQWILTYAKDIFSGELQNSLAKAVGMIAWFGGTVYLIQNVELLAVMFRAYIALAGNLSGLSASDFTPMAIVRESKQVIAAVDLAALEAVGFDITALGASVLAAMYLAIINFLVLVSFGIIALSLFVATLEFWMMFAVAPLMFGLIPLSTFRDQGTAPIKGVMSMGIRILILGVVVAVAKNMSSAVVSALGQTGFPQGQSILTTMTDYLSAMFGCAIMAVAAGKIAAAIASGNASFSGSDAMRTGMTIAAGAGAVAGVAALGVSASKAAMSAAGNAASGAGGAIGNAASAFQARNNVGVSPVSPVSSAGGNQGPPPGWAGGTPDGASAPTIGGSPVEERPHPVESTPSSGATSAPGDASSAGIGGGTPSTSPSQTGKSAFEKAGGGLGKAMEANAQDSHSISVQMHVSKD